MTRINCVPVEQLTDEHLAGEYKEIFRVLRLARHYHARHKGNLSKIPPSYRMGKGHVTFFYNKLLFIINRLNELIDESEKRGRKLNYSMLDSVFKSCEDLPVALMNNWSPTIEAQTINRQRIKERLSNAA